MFGLIWRLLALAALALWAVAALAYGVFLAELSEVGTQEVCQIRQQVFVPEAWERAERGSWWWQFSSACNGEYDLVPNWWALAVLLPVVLSALIARTLLRGGAAPDAVARCAT
ncbi:hypothetical protein [Nocardioides jishulii]|uniref:Transmembrane protein n=1 Tax=Nocardioides jishulii TaxID=2575440 RepID=A0A4U2YTR5_9ACTN|nr:hypothetical protein [Nocardioides jishulii]QCX28838.1 hypothetical protein FCL41_15875 [Nocardioides jishulii]TKI64265.1 hypothetical protein FC770_03690 [Nocardioides jishulii]